MTVALPADQRPVDDTPVHTADLPPTPVRDRNIPATAWVEAPPELLAAGADLPGRPVATYKRRIGRWLLWRAGPATGGDFPTIIKSLEERLFVLPDDTLVMPGHGLDTTIGTERPHLQEWIDRGW